MRVRSASLMLVALALALAVAGTACSPTREEPSTIPANATSAAEATSPAEATETTGEQASPSPSRTEGDHQVIRVNVSNGAVTPPPAPVDVQLGRTVIIEVTSDADDEIHVHGYELTAPVTAGQPSRVTVDATIPGQFEVELHNDELQLFTLRVQ